MNDAIEVDEDLAHLDFETYSEINLLKVGAHRYARHPSTEVLIACWILPGMDEVQTWLPRTQPMPVRLRKWVKSGGKIGAHNAAFERAIWKYTLLKHCVDLPPVADSQWVCTAAKAAASGLPRALDKALMALNRTTRKDAEGGKLIKVFSQPRKPTKADPRTRILPEQDGRFQRFIEYCRQDVIAEMDLHTCIPDLTEREQTFFEQDMRMNDRGLPIDLPMVKKALAIVQFLEAHIKGRVRALSGGINATQVAKMLAVFAERGLELENLRKETVSEALKGTNLSAETRLLLQMRVEAGKAGTKKLAAMVLCADPEDWVVQGGFLFHGAHTGRYSGRLVQFQNFIRGLLKDHQRDAVFRLIELADPELFVLLHEWPIDTISQCMRGFIKAPRGYELAVVDYTAIEARVLAWIAGEEHMLEAYREGVDVYKLMAVRLYGLKSIADVSDEQRRIAKNLVLGCGYQLGGVRFVDYAANAGVIITEEFAKEAVKIYRDGHPAIVASWKTVESLAVQAIRSPGVIARGLKCKFYMRQHWLCVQLPSGRELRYPFAKATPVERWGRPSWQISFRTEIKGQFYRETTYGGKLIENIVQAIARDVMMEGMFNAEQVGYAPIGTVHDEMIALRKVNTTNIKFLEKTVCEIPRWGRGMPLAAKGFVTTRYRKD